jgi:hypothetical protein
VVHGDDFTVLGWYDVKCRGRLGPERNDLKEIKILNRRVAWEQGVITYQADERNIQEVIHAMGLSEESKGLDMAVADSDDQVNETDRDLEVDEAKRFRSVAALANYVALDRPDIQVAVSILCRDMSKPTCRSFARLKRVARYLKKHPTL